MKRSMPIKVANATKNYFIQNFTNQSFDGKAWQEVQRRISGTNANKYAKPSSKTRSILIQSGKLRRAVSTSLRLATFDKIEFLIDGGTIPYAQVHNDGGRAGRGAGFQMPKRQYIGDTKELRKKQIDIIVNEIDTIWK
jgi:phage gpG-like protein